ncbi:M24 family metallopeptidase [Candidatus Hakubella thermalkaliphila]
MKDLIKPGVTTEELDQFAEELILKSGATPAFKGYRGYPKSVCVEINECVVHGIPDSRRLKEGVFRF